MKALTLTQPWAHLVSVGRKLVETRSWYTAYRGPLAIHAAKGLPQAKFRALWASDFQFRQACAAGGLLSADECLRLSRGVILAVTSIVDCVSARLLLNDELPKYRHWLTPYEIALGGFTGLRSAWILGPVQQLHPPIEAKGMLGLWEWTPPAYLEIDDAPNSRPDQPETPVPGA